MNVNHSCPADLEKPGAQYCTFCPLHVPPLPNPASVPTSIETALSDTNEPKNNYAQVQAALLSRDQNRKSPVGKLPDEVLLEIFACCVWASRTHPLDWFNFSWVCHHWRSLALSVPSLWSRQDFCHGTEMIRTMLARAVNTPIYLETTERSRHHPISILYLARHMQDRLKVLSIVPKYYPRRYRDLKRPPLDEIVDLPITESIDIRFENGAPFDVGTLKINSAPRLTKLSLAYCSFDLTEHSLCALTSLIISHPSFALLLNVSEILKILSATPLLQKLDLNHTMQDREVRVTASPVRLPYLKQCILVDASFNCASLLEHVATSHLSELIVTSSAFSSGGTPAESELVDTERMCRATFQQLPINAGITVSLLTEDHQASKAHIDIRDTFGTLAYELTFPWSYFRPSFLTLLSTLGLHALHLDIPAHMADLGGLISLPQCSYTLRVTFRTGVVRIFKTLDLLLSSSEHGYTENWTLPCQNLEISEVGEGSEWPLEAAAILERWHRHGFSFRCRILCEDQQVCEAIVSQIRDVAGMVGVVVEDRAD